MAETREVEGRTDLSTARTLLDDIRVTLDGIDNQHRNVESNNKKRAGHSAQISRELLFAAHLAKTLELAILNEYHAFKGQPTPTIHP